MSKPAAQVIYQTSVDPREFTKTQADGVLRRSPLWPEGAELFDVIVHEKRLSDTMHMQHRKISLTNLAKTAISGLDFSSQAYYQAWDVLCKNFGRLRVIVESQFKKINTYPQVRQDNSNGLVCFANVVTNKVNVLTRLEFKFPGNKGVLNCATRKLSRCLMSCGYDIYRIIDY